MGKTKTAIGEHDCRVIVDECLSHLFGLILPTGRFVYAHRHYHNTPMNESYNLLRHCGTVWFMLSAIKLTGRPMVENERQLLRAAVLYIVAKFKEPVWSGSSLPTLCLTSKDMVKLGGTGLALLVLNTYCDLAKEVIQDRDEFKITSARLENYLVSQLYGTDFIHKRTFSTGAISPFRSDYYTGEALFPLMQSSRRLEKVRHAMEGLLSKGYGLAEQSHWMAYAACTALQTGYCDRDLVANYLRQLVGEIIGKPDYRLRHQSTPIACRSEALAEFLNTAIKVDAEETLFPSDLRQAAIETLKENLALQLSYYGAGQFRKGRESDKVQIDYIQHNAASFLGYWKLARGDADVG